MSGCGGTMSNARRRPPTGSPDTGSSGPKAGCGSKVDGLPKPGSTAIRLVLRTGVLAPGEREVDQRQQGRGSRQALLDDLPTRQPSDFIGVVAGDPLARLPGANDGDQGVVVANPAFLVAVDRVDDGQGTGGLRRDPGLLRELAHRPLGDGLAELEHAARETPAAGHRWVRTAADDHAILTYHHRQHPDDRALRVAASLSPGGARPRQLRACSPRVHSAAISGASGLPGFSNTA